MAADEKEVGQLKWIEKQQVYVGPTCRFSFESFTPQAENIVITA